MPNNNSSLYGTTSNVTVSANNLTTLYNTTPGNVVTVSVPDRNLTTLYASPTTEVNPTRAYGNANVERFLNAGTDGGNTITNIVATGNVTADYFIGNLVGNITGDANYANFAGTIVANGYNQPNIHLVGNLYDLQVSDSNADFTNQVVFNFNPLAGVGPQTPGRQGIEFNLYANAANGEFNTTESYVRYRGTPNNPTAGANTDFVQRSISLAYDGNTLTRIAQFQTILSNLVSGNPNGSWSGGSYNFNTGNPFGNVAYQTNNSSGFNSFSMNEIGSITASQGIAPSTGSTAQISLTSYGRNTANPAVSAGMNFLRARGNREANLSLEPSDEIYRIGAVPYNGTAFSAGGGNGASFRAQVDSTYVANSANVPIGFNVRVVDSNNFARQANFYANGDVTLSANLSVAGNSDLGSNANVKISGGSANYALITDGAGNLSWGQVANAANANFANFANYANFANVSNIANSVNVANVVGIGNIATINLDGNSSNVLFGNGVFSNVPSASKIANGTSNVNIPVANGNVLISVNGVSNIATFQSNSVTLNYPINTPNNIMIGNLAGNRSAAQNNIIAIGYTAAVGSDAQRIIAIGYEAGWQNQQGNAIAIGVGTGMFNQGYDSVAIGRGAGGANQYNYSVALGPDTGANAQGNSAVAIGDQAGYTGQAGNNIAIGRRAAYQGQSGYAVAIGENAGTDFQGYSAISIGVDSGAVNQKSKAVAIGHYAGYTGQGANAIAVGANAGYTNQANNSIILNATGANLDQTTANTFTVKPVRNANTANVMFYNNTTGEITYDVIGNTTVANANYANFAGNAFSVSGSNVVGDVSGANHANIADVANSVAGANVSGEVANANYATYAGTSAVANSVAVANVVGIGNIATINLDGNGANVLHGNGVFAPEASDGNANYANFSGTLINGTSNVTIPSANGNIQISVNGNANIGTFDSAGTGALTLNPLISQNNGLRISSVGRGGTGNGASRLTWIKSSGTLINGTSNVTIPSANGNIQISVNGNANIGTFDSAGTGALTLNPLISQNNGLRITSVGRGGTGNGASRLTWIKSRGTLTTPLSVEPTDYVAEILGVGHNGTAAQTNSLAFVRAQVDSSYVANGANIPLGWRISVNDTNGGINNQTKTHDFYSNGNVSFANSVVVNNDITSTNGNLNVSIGNLTVSSGNITATSGTFFGNGAGLTNINGSNVSNVANANYANFAGTLINGTSNLAIVANGVANFSLGGTANVITLGNGTITVFPGSNVNNGLTVNGYGSNPVGDQWRIASFRYRGNIASPLSVQPNDATMRLLTTGSNGTALQTSSIASLTARVDASYTANGANIPLGWQISVNDTNGGVNNQTKTHNFYSNGNVAFTSSLSMNGNLDVGGNVGVTGNLNVGSGARQISTQQLYLSGYANGATGGQLFLVGNGTPSCGIQISQAPFVATLDNVNPTTGISPFFFNTYDASNNYIPPQRFFRSRGTLASPAAVVANDTIASQSFAVYADSGNTYLDVVDVFVNVISNDGVGNVAGQYVIQAGAGSAGIANSSMYVNVPTSTFTGKVNFGSGNSVAYANGDSSFANVSASNVSVNTNGFMKLASYTAAALTAITGQIGWMAAVSDSAAGSNPNGMIAFWDTTNSRWSYIHDNSAV